tara:strand:+ start:2911 stop:3330 length:420 start_codon:yes stop_codon:yes gene_type:complete
MSSEWLYVLVSIALACTILVQAIIQYRKFKSIHTKLAAVTLIVKDQSKQTELIKTQLHELRSGSLGVGKRVLALQEHIDTCQTQIEEMQLQDPDAKIYSRALKMVGLGAELDEIIRECELPQAEVELLIRLHRQETVHV